MIFPLINFFLVLFAIIVISTSIKIIREDERVVIFRLGRYLGIGGPGIVIKFPFVDKIVKINLTKSVPGWQTLSKETLNEKIKSIVLYGVKMF